MAIVDVVAASKVQNAAVSLLLAFIRQLLQCPLYARASVYGGNERAIQVRG